MFFSKQAIICALLITAFSFCTGTPLYAKTLNHNNGNPIRPDTVVCPKSEEIEKIISEAISLGAPIYNQGMHLACYRIYEWAGYKILYEYGELCPEAKKTLKTAIDKSHGDFSDTEKAWLMRVAFDKIMGVPTQTTLLKKGEAPL